MEAAIELAGRGGHSRVSARRVDMAQGLDDGRHGRNDHNQPE